MKTDINAGERLYESLQWGFCAVDSELFSRARAYPRWAKDNPTKALELLPKLRKTGEGVTTGDRWAAVADIVEGAHKANATNEPVDIISPKALPLRPLIPNLGELPAEYEEWKSKNVPAAELSELKQVAPLPLKDALSLEERAKQCSDVRTQQFLLKEASLIFVRLLDIEEPVYGK